MNCVRVVGGEGLCTDQHSNMACCVARLDASISAPCHTAVGQCLGSNNSPWLHHTGVCSRLAGFHLVDTANPRPPGWNTWTAAAGSCVNVCNGHYIRLPALLRFVRLPALITMHYCFVHHWAPLQNTPLCTASTHHFGLLACITIHFFYSNSSVCMKPLLMGYYSRVQGM